MVSTTNKAFYTRYLERILDLFEDYGLDRERRLVEDFLGKLYLLDVLNEKIEGIYRVSFGGHNYTMTVFRTSNVELNIVIHSEFVSYSMVRPTYNSKSKEIVVDRFFDSDGSPGPGPDVNYQFRIKSFNGSSIQGVFTNGLGTYTINASRIKKIPDYRLLSGAGAPQDPSGTYKGPVNDAFLKSAQLIVTKNRQRVTGTLNFNPDQQSGQVRVTFGNGYFVNNGALYLTSNETPSGNVIHMRGQIKYGKFKGVYIAGGKTTPLSFDLRKL